MEQTKQTRGQRFVSWVLEKCTQEPRIAAQLRRADNPATEYYALGILCSFNVNVEQDGERLAFATVGAALCRQHSQQDGRLGLGAALRFCFETSEQGNIRLRRLLTCESQAELCRILRPLLSLIQARGAGLCYAALLDDLLLFKHDDRQQRVKLRWAQEYYRSVVDEDAQDTKEETTYAAS